MPSFMTIHSEIQVILKLPQQFEGLQCSYWRWDEFVKYANETGSGGMIYVHPKYHDDRFSRSSNIKDTASTI
jgi:hypothetical protein